MEKLKHSVEVENRLNEVWRLNKHTISVIKANEIKIVGECSSVEPMFSRCIGRTWYKIP